MILETLDWIIIIGFAVLIVGVGLSYTRQAGKNLDSFFLGGRNLPWYIAGISMVATTFAADTPLAVTELVGQSGIAGNWLWWSFLAGGMLTTFFFARLWRKSGVLTEVELIELRYSGPQAAALRGLKAVYLGLFINAVIIAWVNVALMSLLEVFFELSKNQALMWTAVAMLIVAIYSSLSGLLGVAMTDVIQFVVAITGCVILAVLVLNSDEVGGISGLKTSLPDGTLNFLPTIGEGDGLGKTLGLSVGAFFAYMGVQWWASWYPGAEPGGGGYIAQRMMSAKSEKDAIYATLFFQIAHYCIRPWPWILVGLCALSLYNLNDSIQDTQLKQQVVTIQNEAKKADAGLDNSIFTLNAIDIKEMASDNEFVEKNIGRFNTINSSLASIAKEDEQLDKAMIYSASTGKGFVIAMRDFLPTGLKGLLLVAFFAAYMSTISTQLNWGASYLVNDLYKRFIAPDSSDKQLITASRICTILLMLVGLAVSTRVNSISGAWGFLMQCGAGLGLVLILRWYWWRINAWSEIAATFAPFVAMAILQPMGLEFPDLFLYTVLFTTIVWLAVTFLTPPTDRDKLLTFYNQVQPDGAWGIFNASSSATRVMNLFICWLSAIAMTYGILFLIGKIIFQEWATAGMLAVLVLVSFVILRIFVGKTRIFE